MNHIKDLKSKLQRGENMVPKIINNLFKQEGIKRNTRIHFPDGERPDICNSNIESNSINIENPLCSSDELKFGLCESSIFECNVVNIENKNIPTKTSSGTNIHLTDSVKAPLAEIVIDGNTVEKGTGAKSPENPYTFASVGEDGSVAVTACGKNKISGSQDFSGKWVNSSNWVTDGTYKGLTVKKRTEAWFGIYKSLYVEVGKTYCFSAYVKSTVATQIYIYPTAGSHAVVSTSSKNVVTSETDYTRVSLTFKCTESGYICPRVEISKSGELYVCGYQLEESVTMTDYEPYKSQSITIPLSEPLRSVGEVKDTIERQNGIYGIVRRTSKIVLDGTESWGKLGAPNDTFYCTSFETERLPIDGKSICNITDSYGAAGTSSGYQIHEFVEKTEVYINFGSDIMTTNTVDFFKQYLAEHNVTIIYATKESVFEPFPDDIQSLFATTITFKGITDITATDNANMSIRYQCNDMALGQEIIKNPYPDRGNIKGCKIEVFSEIDVSSLTEEEIAEYGQTAEDVPFPFYRVPRFSGTVYSCKKQSNMDMRKIVAYDALNSDNLDRNVLPFIRRLNGVSSYIESIDYSHLKGYGPAIKISPSYSNESILREIAEFVGARIEYYGEQLNSGTLQSMKFPDNLKKCSEEIVSHIGGQKTEYYVQDSSTVSGKLEHDLYYSLEGNLIGTVEKIEIPSGKFKVEVEYDIDVVKEFNEKMNKIEGSNLTVQDRVDYLNEIFVFVGDFEVYGDSVEGSSKYSLIRYARIMPNTIIDCDNYKDFTDANSDNHTGYFMYPGELNIVEVDAEHQQSISGSSGITIYSCNVLKGIKIIPVEDSGMLINGNSKFPIEYYKENDNTNVDTDKLTGRNIISSILEMNGLFGKIDESGLFTLRKLGKPYWQLSNAWQLSGAWVLNYSTECRIPQGEEESAWYDEDYESSLYGAVKISGDNNTLICKYIGNPGGLKTYNITNNLLLCNGLYSQTEMYEILKNMFARIQSVRFTPMMISCKSLPDRETGDKIIISDDGKEISTYIFNKVTSGIMALMDEIDNTNMN